MYQPLAVALASHWRIDQTRSLQVETITALVQSLVRLGERVRLARLEWRRQMTLIYN